MKTYKFYKEASGRWYIDLPFYPGTQADLEMVAGADSMLDYMAEGENKVSLCISEEEYEGGDLLELIEILQSGANYYLMICKGVLLNINMWLCDVTKFVFGKFPEKLYICKV